MDGQRFGGKWTDQKLQVLHDYLVPYLQIFRSNPRAQYLSPIYVDAFAGCGTRAADQSASATEALFESPEDRAEAIQFVASSPRVALSLSASFDRYIFIEREARHAAQLRAMVRSEYADREADCTVLEGDANEVLPEFCDRMGRHDRAVMFLDPYGAEVEWNTLVAIGASKKVDLWLLFPYTGLLRMLPRTRMPDHTWAARVTTLLGTDDWRNWYQEQETTDLFGDTTSTVTLEMEASAIMSWVAQRMKKIFAATIDEPLVLRNSRGSPLFMLMFAAGNPKGARVACKIAQDIITAQRRND